MKAELLAPAGSYEALTAALSAGADAVYLGGAAFGARAYAKNLTEEEVLRAIDFVHLHGKKLYLTVNTLLKEEELEERLYPYLLPYYRQGLDAVTVQDLGAMRAIRRWFPKLPIHVSTQMTVTGSAAARMLEKEGAVRVVPARELSLAEIQRIRRTTNLEIECFVHGALCYCYSGQCLMSSLIGGRSGNRGRCAQPCRLPYEVYEKGRRLGERGDDYPLSPKDMCTVELLPEILQAGVTSLKIEGRMKKPEYTAGVVSVYRKYLDLYEENPGRYRVLPEDLKKLYDIYNRDGFNQSYYKVRNGREMMALKNEKQTVGSQRGRRNEQLFYDIRKKYLETPLREPVSGCLTLCKGTPAVLTVYAGDACVTVEKDGIQQAKRQPLSEARVREQMEKTGNTPFRFEQLDIFMEDDIFVPMQFLSELRREAMERLEQELVVPFRRKEKPQGREAAAPDAFEKTGFVSEDHENSCEKNPTGDEPEKTENRMVRVTASAQTRQQLDTLLQFPEFSVIYADMFCFSKEYYQEEAGAAMAKAREQGITLMLALPHAVREGQLNPWKETFRQLAQEGLGGFLVRNLESYGFLEEAGLADRVVTDYSLYTMNHRAQDFWEQRSVLRDTAPLELNRHELARRDNSRSELMVYGYLPMMVSAQCVKKTMDGCNGRHALITLKDRYGINFSVKCHCEFCYNVIYNSLPLGLLKEAWAVKALEPCAVRLSFTMESAAQTERIAGQFLGAYLHGQVQETSQEYTKGHFRRSVE